MMRSQKLFFVVLLPAMLLSACATVSAPAPTASVANPDERPAWIDNPGNGVSASCATHIRGRAAQEELAIARARAEFAKRFGVSIEAGQVVATSVANGQASTAANSLTQEHTSQSDVKAVVKAKWLDPGSDVLWVWLVPGN